MPLASISSIFTNLVGDYGLYAVFLLMLIDAVLPAASELVMVYAGALASGAFASQQVTLFGTEIEPGLGAFFALALAGAIGYLIGSIGGWAIGVYGGRAFLERHGKLVHLSPAKLTQAEGWFDRFGDWAVFIGRITPVARSFVSIPAGVFKAPLWRYTWLTAIGSSIWAFAFAAAGYQLGSHWERLHEGFRFVDYAIVLAILGAAGWWLMRRRRASRA